MLRRWGRLVSLALAIVAAGCTRPAPVRAPIPPVSTGKVRVRVFTEPSPVKTVTTVGRFVFVATDRHLERWDDEGSVLALSAADGLAGEQIVAVAPDPVRRWVWILTDRGLGYYDASAEVYRPQPAPPASLGIDFAAMAKEGASLAPAVDEGVWLGGAHGLVYAGANGTWAASTGVELERPIRALARDQAGWLWVASVDGLVARKPGGETVRIGDGHGLGIAAPRLLVELPGDRLLVIGADATGQERLAIGQQLAWTTYRALPEVTWDAAARRGDGAVVMGGGRVYRISPAQPGRVRPLARDGMRMVSLSGGPSGWDIDPLDVQTPPGAVSLGAAGDQLLIGTRELGTARFRDGDARPLAWLRRRPMFQDATGLSVACAREQDCWIATGGRQAWHWTGGGFVPGGPDEVVLAVVRDPAGPIYALHRGVTATEIGLSRIDGATWTPVPRVALTTPGTAPEINFARFATTGALWIGLRYRDGAHVHAYGLAIVEPATGKVTYHRTAATADARHTLPIPDGVIDADVRGDTAYFATSDGVARLRGGEVELWTETDGLGAEPARAVTIAANDDVIIATAAGAGRFDGKRWEFPAALRFEVNDVVATRNGQVWMATARGIAAWDGAKLRRVDTRRGLAENHVLDIAIDQYDRLWARGPGSLTLISQ